jgi:hypothetical protein
VDHNTEKKANGYLEHSESILRLLLDELDLQTPSPLISIKERRVSVWERVKQRTRGTWNMRKHVLCSGVHQGQIEIGKMLRILLELSQKSKEYNLSVDFPRLYQISNYLGPDLIEVLGTVDDVGNVSLAQFLYIQCALHLTHVQQSVRCGVNKRRKLVILCQLCVRDLLPSQAYALYASITHDSVNRARRIRWESCLLLLEWWNA